MSGYEVSRRSMSGFAQSGAPQNGGKLELRESGCHGTSKHDDKPEGILAVGRMIDEALSCSAPPAQLLRDFGLHVRQLRQRVIGFLYGGAC